MENPVDQRQRNESGSIDRKDESDDDNSRAVTGEDRVSNYGSPAITVIASDEDHFDDDDEMEEERPRRKSSWPLSALERDSKTKLSGNRQLSFLRSEESLPNNLNLNNFRSSRSTPESSRRRTGQLILNPSNEPSRPYEPPDGDWGWVCVGGAFVNYFLVVGLTRSFGAVYEELRAAFPDSTHSQIATIPSIISTLVIGLALLAGALSKRFSCRVVAFVGGLLCSTSVCLCYFASNLIYLTIYFIFAGIGAALTTTPGILTVAVYFRKKRAIATGLCLSGSAIGSIVQPPLLQFLTRKLGFRSALLVLGLLMFTTCLAALTFKDPEVAYFARRREAALNYRHHSAPVIRLERQISTQSSVDDSNAIEQTSSSVGDDDNRTQHHLPDDDKVHAMQFIAYDIGFVADVGTDRISENLINAPVQSSKSVEDGLPSSQTSSLSMTDVRSAAGQENLLTPESNNQTLVASISSTHSEVIPTHSRRERQIELQPILPVLDPNHLSVDQQTAPTNRRLWSTTGLTTSEDSMLLSEFRTHKEARYSILERSNNNKCVLWVKRHLYVDITVLKNPVFVIVIISSTLMMAVYPTGLIFIPPYGISQGVEKTMASVLLSVAAAGDLAGRLLCGWILDKNLISKHHAYMAGITMLGVSYILLASSNMYWLMAICAFVYGINGGLSILTLPILLADHHGADLLPSTYGLARLGQAVVGLASPPLAGYLRDETGTFIYGFIFMGGTAIVGGAIALGIPLVKHRYREQVKKQRDPRKQRENLLTIAGRDDNL